MSDSFYPLACHSYFSLMWGTASPEGLCRRAKESGVPGLALTDREGLYGILPFWEAARDSGLKPILGAEITEANGAPEQETLGDEAATRRTAKTACAQNGGTRAQSQRRRGMLPACTAGSSNCILARHNARPQFGTATDGPLGRKPSHDLILGPVRLLATGPRGYRRLARLLTLYHQNKGRPAFGRDEGRSMCAPTRGKGTRPREGSAGSGFSLLNALLEDRRGLVVLSSSSPFLERLGRETGLEGLYLALPPLGGQRELMRSSRRSGIPLAAVASVYFLDPGDFLLHKLLRAIGLSTKLERVPADELAPIWACFQPVERWVERYLHCPEALAGMREISEICSLDEPPWGEWVFPPFEGFSHEEAFALLERKARAGACRRYGENGLSEALLKRLDYELEVIRSKSLASYFLVVEDIVQRFPVTCGRGSAAASLVSYCLGITHVDPMRHNLFFERFLNLGRTEPPDIDVDFPWDERDHVLSYVLEKYGPEHSAMVANHVGFGARAALRETAKVYGVPEEEIEQVTRGLTRTLGNPFDLSLEDARIAETAAVAQGWRPVYKDHSQPDPRRSVRPERARGGERMSTETEGSPGSRMVPAVKPRAHGTHLISAPCLRPPPESGRKQLLRPPDCLPTKKHGSISELRTHYRKDVQEHTIGRSDPSSEIFVHRRQEGKNLACVTHGLQSEGEAGRLTGSAPTPAREPDFRHPGFQEYDATQPTSPAHEPDFRHLLLQPPWPQVFHWASRLEGMPRHLSVHCGGVVITPDALPERVPVEQARKGVPVIQWEKDITEAAGLVKIDLLGNRSLAVIRDTLAAIRANGGERISYSRFDPLEDPRTREMISRGDTVGVFYTESPSMRQLLKKTGTGDYEHLVVQSSIIRPAANEFVREYVRRVRGGSFTWLHPLLADILDETHGILCYQEDVSRVAMALAGFDAVQADLLRKVLSKKHRHARLTDFRERFRSGALARGVAPGIVEEVWRMILSFQGYSFCKPHSASYALVSFKACYLKGYYPAEFMAAVISNQGGYYTTMAYLSEVRRMGLTILPPDVNESDFVYTGRGRSIRVGLMQLKGVRIASLEALLAERARRGPFRSLAELLERVDTDPADFRILIKAGCMDSISGGRPQPELLWKLLAWEAGREARSGRRGRRGQRHSQTALKTTSAFNRESAPAGAGRLGTKMGKRKANGLAESFREGLASFSGYSSSTSTTPGENRTIDAGRGSCRRGIEIRPMAGGRNGCEWEGQEEALLFQADGAGKTERDPDIGASALFSDTFEPPRSRPYSPLVRLRHELETLGLMVSQHPLELYRPLIERLRPVPASELGRHVGKRVTMVGWFVTSKTVLTNREEPMEFVSFEDTTALYETTFFPKAYKRFCQIVGYNRPYVLKGRVEEDFGALSLTVDDVAFLEKAAG